MAPPSGYAAHGNSSTERMHSSVQQGIQRDAGILEDVLVEDGTVRDCITGDRRGTGKAGKIRTVEWNGTMQPETGEDRTASINSFRSIYLNKVWVAAPGAPVSGGLNLCIYAYSYESNVTGSMQSRMQCLLLQNIQR